MWCRSCISCFVTGFFMCWLAGLGALGVEVPEVWLLVLGCVMAGVLVVITNVLLLLLALLLVPLPPVPLSIPPISSFCTLIL